MGTAYARDLPPPSAAESPLIVEPSLFDPNSIGTARAQYSPPSNAAESPPIVESSSSEAISIGTGGEQSLRPPNPIEAQRNAVDRPFNAVDRPFDASSVGTARAQYLPSPTVPQTPTFIQSQHVSVSSSFDADSLGNRNVYVDSTFAPFSGIYESGARFRLTGNASWYKFVTSEDPRTLGSGRSLDGGLLAGYGFVAPGFSVTWLVGPAFGETVNTGVVTDRWGAKASIEMYATPTDLTMASASVSYSTVANYLQVQTKAGLKIFGDVYFGPEAKFAWQQILPFQVNFSTTTIATTTPVSPQTNIATVRVGGHFSALNIGPVAIGVSGGWAHDRQLGSGYYGSVSFYQAF
jgi:hypothetical protein